MGGSSSSSSTSSSSTVNTTNVTDSYNRTYNRVSNLSNVGNISIGDELVKALSGSASSSGAAEPALFGVKLVPVFIGLIGVLLALKIINSLK